MKLMNKDVPSAVAGKGFFYLTYTESTGIELLKKIIEGCSFFPPQMFIAVLTGPFANDLPPWLFLITFLS